MTLKECTAILTPLVMALRADFDAPTYRAYHRALDDVPSPLLQSAVDHAMRTATFVPKPGELRTLAEDARRALIAAHPYEPCAECHHIGTVAIRVSGLPVRYEKCRCWRAYQMRLANLGIQTQPIQALPAAMETA